MRKLFILAFAFTMLVFGPAQATQCPRDLQALDTMMREHLSMLSAAKQTEVRNMRDDAQKLHAAGRHSESMAKIEQARKAVGM